MSESKNEIKIFKEQLEYIDMLMKQLTYYFGSFSHVYIENHKEIQCYENHDDKNCYLAFLFPAVVHFITYIFSNNIKSEELQNILNSGKIEHKKIFIMWQIIMDEKNFDFPKLEENNYTCEYVKNYGEKVAKGLDNISDCLSTMLEELNKLYSNFDK